MIATRSGPALAKRDLPPEVERALRSFFEDYTAALEPLRRDLLDAIRAGDIDPSSSSSVRTGVERVAGSYTSDVYTVYEEGTAGAASAGRQAAVRAHRLDVAFDVVPRRTLEELEDWSEEATKHSMSTLTDETVRFVRAAHEEGTPIPDLADQLNDDLFGGRLQDWQAERTARTATIPSSNAGHHSAHQDSSAVVAEQWLATKDGRTRDTHRSVDGQIAAVDGTFLVGGHRARYPGDPALPLDELVQCRCRAVPVFRDQLSDSEFAVISGGGRVEAAMTGGEPDYPREHDRANA